MEKLCLLGEGREGLDWHPSLVFRGPDEQLLGERRDAGELCLRGTELALFQVERHPQVVSHLYCRILPFRGVYVQP